MKRISGLQAAGNKSNPHHYSEYMELWWLECLARVEVHNVMQVMVLGTGVTAFRQITPNLTNIRARLTFVLKVITVTKQLRCQPLLFNSIRHLSWSHSWLQWVGSLAETLGSNEAVAVIQGKNIVMKCKWYSLQHLKRRPKELEQKTPSSPCKLNKVYLIQFDKMFAGWLCRNTDCVPRLRGVLYTIRL